MMGVTYEGFLGMGAESNLEDVVDSTHLGHNLRYRTFTLAHADGYYIYGVSSVLYCPTSGRLVSLIYMNSVITSETTALTNFNAYKNSFICHS